MKNKLAWLTVIAILVCSPGWTGQTPPPGELPAVNMEKVAKIQVGVTTGDEIKALLGPPYRMTNYGDCNPIDYQEFWEYLGRDASGIFKIHIEFDEAHIARIIAKDAKKGPIVVLAAAPKPVAVAQHQH